MLNPILHRYIFLFGLIGLAVGMSFGTVPTSIPEIILFSNWIFEGQVKRKWHAIKSNWVFWTISSLFFIHIIGLIHTQNILSALSDIRIKVPLLVLPLIFFTTAPISKNELTNVFKLFIVAVVVSSIWCLIYYYSNDIIDIRKTSRFMSHIRFGLFINLAICFSFLLFLQETKLRNKIFFSTCIFYLLIVMLILGMITGLILFLIIFSVYSFYLILTQKPALKVIGLSLIVIVLFSALNIIKTEWNNMMFIENNPANKVKEKTLSGRTYFKIDPTNLHTENGYYIAYNIQYDELIRAWNNRSKINPFVENENGKQIIWCAVRYLSSKGLTKDSAGMAQLSEEDINHIEEGYTNYKYVNASPLRIRLKQFFWEYKDYKLGFNPSGNTMLMRLEFWDAAIYVIKRNVLFGVGTGDAQKAFDRAYYRTKSKLTHDWRLRSHNQFLAITVCFGIIGLSVFLFSIIFPSIYLRKYLHKLYWMFLVIALVSFLTEDTLETQTGATFFAYFNSLFLWLANAEKREKEKAV